MNLLILGQELPRQEDSKYRGLDTFFVSDPGNQSSALPKVTQFQSTGSLVHTLICLSQSPRSFRYPG